MYPWERLPNSARHVLASASSGAITVTLLAPIEVVRVNLVVNSDASLRTAFSSLKGASLRTAFRGNSADVLAGAARLGIIMPMFSVYKDAARRVYARLDPAHVDADAPLPIVGRFCAGALAGCTATAILFPLEVARTRMAMECHIDSVYSCLESVRSAEGLGALYRGLATSIAGVMPFNAIKLSSYDLLRQRALVAVGGAGGALPPVWTAAVGALAGVTAATACFPLEVVRRRQIMGQLSGLGVGPAVVALARAEGAAALYRGVFVNVAKVSLSNGVGFVLYEALKDAFCVDGHRPPWERCSRPARA